MFASLVSEAGLRNARKKEPYSRRSTFDREAVAFSISVSRQWTSTTDEYNPFFSLLRDSIVDFGGEFISCSPLETSIDDLATKTSRGEMIIEGLFLAGELPVRQSGGSKMLIEISDAVEHYIAFIQYLFHDESFFDSTVVYIDGEPVQSISAAAASVGVITLDISSEQGASCLAASPAIDEARSFLQNLTACGIPKSPSDPAILCSPRFESVLQHMPEFMHLKLRHHTPPNLPPFCNALELLRTGTLSNPGIGMPLAFVRRFHNDLDLIYANGWMKNSMSALLRGPLDAGEQLQISNGVCYQSSFVAMCFASNFNTGSPGSPKLGNPQSRLGDFRNVISAITKELDRNNGGVLSSVISSAELHISVYLQTPVTTANFFLAKLARQFSPATKTSGSSPRPAVRDSRRKGHAETNNSRMVFGVVEFGDISWRAGVNGSVVPYGSEVDVVTGQFQKLLKETSAFAMSISPPEPRLFCSVSSIVAELDSSLGRRSMLIEYDDIPNHPDWKAPRDVLSAVVTEVFSKSYVAGRQETRKILKTSLERLLLVDGASTTILEARAGFGKSMVADEVVAIANKLHLPHLVSRTSSSDRSNLKVWADLCCHLIHLVEQTMGDEADEYPSLSLLKHLPEELGIAELSWLNELLPSKYRVTEKQLREDNPDSNIHDLVASAEDGRANSILKLDIFGHLLKSLVQAVPPFIFVIEDLQWMDSTSWKLLVSTSNHWSHGCMIVCTTRPIPAHASFFYSSICSAPRTSREVLDNLKTADLASLAKLYLPKASITSKLLQRLQEESQGFPFLATELLREASDDIASSLIGQSELSKQTDDKRTGAQEEIIVSTKDPYTDEELENLKSFYNAAVSDSGWTEYANIEGVQYFERSDEDSAVRQGKAIGIVPNSTPLSILTGIINSARTQGHKWHSTKGNRRVVEDINDHSAVTWTEMLMPRPLTHREVVQRYIWKEMEPGVYLFLSRSVEHDGAPHNSGYVRANLKFFAHILKPCANGISTHEVILGSADPGGIIPKSVVNAKKMDVLKPIGRHIKWFGAREDHGVPLLKVLVEKRLEKVRGKRLLGMMAIVHDVVNDVEELAQLVGQETTSVETDIAILEEERFLEKTERGFGSLRVMIKHKFISEVAILILEEKDKTTAHKYAAETLITQFRSSGEKVLALLPKIAHHCTGAKMAEARGFSMLAANAALENHDRIESMNLYDQTLRLIREGGETEKKKNQPLPGFHNHLHEELHCLVNMGDLSHAEVLFRESKNRLIPDRLRYSMTLQGLRRLRPSKKIVSSAERGFHELQAKMWSEVLEASKNSVSKTQYKSYLVRQLRASTKSGKTDSFIIALLSMSRYFVQENRNSEANHFVILAEQFFPSEPSLLLEGWASFCRGEMLCSEGNFDEGQSFYRSAAEEWMEGEHVELWMLALKHYTLSMCMTGDFFDASAFLKDCAEDAINVRSERAKTIILQLNVFVSAEMGHVKGGTFILIFSL
jgi:hypothetical protein